MDVKTIFLLQDPRLEAEWSVELVPQIVVLISVLMLQQHHSQNFYIAWFMLKKIIVPIGQTDHAFIRKCGIIKGRNGNRIIWPVVQGILSVNRNRKPPVMVIIVWKGMFRQVWSFFILAQACRIQNKLLKLFFLLNKDFLDFIGNFSFILLWFWINPKEDCCKKKYSSYDEIIKSLWTKHRLNCSH